MQNPQDRPIKVERPERPQRYEPDDDPTPKKTYNPLLLMAVAVALSILVSMYWTNNLVGGFVSKADIEDLSKSVSAAQASLTSSVNALPTTVTAQVNTVMGGINNQLNSMQNTVNDLKSQVSGYSGKIDTAASSASSASSKASSLSDSIDSLSTKISDLQTSVNDIKTRVAALESSGSSSSESTSNSDDVTAKVKAMSSLMIPTSDTVLMAQFKIELTNETSEDIEDLILDVYMETGVTYSGIESFTLTGGGTMWQGYGWSAQSHDFINSQWGLNLDANQTKTLYLTATVTGNTTADFLTRYPTGVGYNVDVEVD